MSWASPEDIYLSTSLASYLDKKLLVLLRDGRKLLGTLRSFDQFANAVLEGACERVIVGEIYCDIPLGLYIIRGENVVLIGELDVDKEELPPHMTRVPEAEIRRVQLGFMPCLCKYYRGCLVVAKSNYDLVSLSSLAVPCIWGWGGDNLEFQLFHISQSSRSCCSLILARK
ncbi:hypothetical protein KY290_028620 [Solanum tuberosum]|uniref:U6 snRNA-associated Sm-like protein LSm1 n=1 Tax=Solanum tuberosum TaxID=4113 RepID=A0ABQ7UIF7_SOLTU|nr:hypothetical protein KY290_028620 [Solanum tuberosum]